MLELKNIKKDYDAGGGVIHALKGISLQFRNSEFVSILGPSGCGKTTMLNIIGGLDKYTEGDLVINGRSTKGFSGRDWDTYRNHSIGFVFQSYNLIPHQSVLSNVELALTLTGVGKKERRERAKDVLEKVGLADQINKKPNTLSGGQMQRVAIARALVNNPDIILADEPTGALDSETSVQVMELLKEVSKERLVIMVTHNPELADKYSSRIIRMLDGNIIDDSNPLTNEDIREAEKSDFSQTKESASKSSGAAGEKTASCAKTKSRQKKPTMSLGTSFGLSLRNLFTKKGRTILTAFAGSIGIIGISLILAVSAGTTTYISAVQEETLTSYPITLQKTTVDLTSVMNTFMSSTSAEVEHDSDHVYRKSAAYDIVNAFNNMEETENDLQSFNDYLKGRLADSEDKLSQAVNAVQYEYGLDLQIYTKNVDGNITKADSEKLLSSLVMEHMGLDLEAMSSFGGMSSLSSLSDTFSSSETTLWQELIPGKNGEPVNELIERQYDLVYGSWPKEYNEIVLILDENNELDDITLYALGLLSKEEMDEMMEAAVNGDKIENKTDSWSYEDLCGKEYRTILNSSCYAYNESTGLWEDMRNTDTGIKYLYDNAIPLKVTGIIRPNEDYNTTMLTGKIAYTHYLTEHVIEQSESTDIIKAQKDNEKVDILTGLPFKENTSSLTDAEKETEFRNYVKELSTEKKAELYIKAASLPDEEFLDEQEEQIVGGMSRQDIEDMIFSSLSGDLSVSEDEIRSYVNSMSDEELEEVFRTQVRNQISEQYAEQVKAQLASMTTEQLAAAMDLGLETYTTKECAKYYDEILEFSDSTYEDNLAMMGDVDLDNPTTINIYASSFENKDVITEAIAEYNNGVSELYKIRYTDYVGIMMSSITTIINAITYVLIAFVAISLIVSSIMIGVITLISVQERTKEIGILRAIGASKKNVSSLFSAETLIIGFVSGLIGVLITYLLCIPINLILHSITGISNLSAVLPIPAAIILVLISMALTLVAGIIPSRSAAKKDPAVALRTE